MMFFKSKKPENSEPAQKTQDNIDLQIINKMNPKIIAMFTIMFFLIC